ncbi:flagellar protein FliS [uncultured Sphingomonas sp.]|uniref:flagellar export chaperone FliS n=1 Tax=uncultured Sphingomonas sp. TaxID=158754 RepID=UPI0035CB93D8
MAYATVLARDPAATYRQVDVAGRTAGADAPALVQLLYEELIAALRAAAWATDARNFAKKGERITRATAILFALEAGLDHERGGALSGTLAKFYAGARRTIVDASIGHDSMPFRDAAASMGEIASAWTTARAA